MRLFWILAAAATACAQPISFGGRIGAPLSDAFKAGVSGNLSYASTSRRLVIGPTVELNLPFRTSIALDLLHRQLGYAQVSPGQASVTSANQWEFPLILKHRLNDGLARPYLGAGVAFSKLSGVKTLAASVATLNTPEFRKGATAGIVFAGGVEVRALLVKISPEIRYTYRSSRHFQSAVADLLRSNVNQFDFLLGVTF
jgi:hypothetical protein